ncbi:MAG TPA: PEP-CTERM sorting domain-containing protein [Planctomycetes bacterium]|nr:PEP-CTERM sorting domain-containing protein [Planctomycetota bacterium]
MTGATAYFSINADNAGEPGDVQALVELTGITTSQQVLRVDFTDELILGGDTSYWLVGGTNQGQVNWNFGDMAFGTAAYRVDEGEWTILSGANVSAFAILGNPVPEPSTILLLGLGVPFLSGLRRKR